MEISDADDMELRVIDEEVRKKRSKRFYQAWGIILFSIGIGFLGGFLFSTFLLFFGFALIFGKKENLLRNTIVGIGMTVLTYFTFEVLLGVPLLEGLFWRFF